MFIGHFAVGFAAKRAAPRTSLATLIVAAIFLDMLWPVFVRLGLLRLLEAVINAPLDRVEMRPYTHSLFMAVVWALVFALVYQVRARYRTGAVVVALAVLSHWFLDVISHDPDLPLAPWLPDRVGVPLGGSPLGMALIECAVFATGIAIYLFITRAKGWQGHVSLWSVVGVLLVAYLMNNRVVRLPGMRVLHSMFLLVPAVVMLLWFVWVERSRTLRGAAGPPGSA